MASQLLDMAERYYDEVQALKIENDKLNGRAHRPHLKPSTIAKEDKIYRKYKILQNTDIHNTAFLTERYLLDLSIRNTSITHSF